MHVLIVEDDARLQSKLAASFLRAGFNVVVTCDQAQACLYLLEHMPDVLVVNAAMQNPSGPQALMCLNRLRSEVKAAAACQVLWLDAHTRAAPPTIYGRPATLISGPFSEERLRTLPEHIIGPPSARTAQVM